MSAIHVLSRVLSLRLHADWSPRALLMVVLGLAEGLFPNLAVAQWAHDGVPVCADSGGQAVTDIVSDGARGAIIVWQDQRTGLDVYAQRVDSTGRALWTPNGIFIAPTSGLPRAVADGSGGAIVVWDLYLGTTSNDILAQRVNGSGVAQWTVAVCTAPLLQINPRLVSDGAGGAIITWQDDRDLFSTGYDIYAQRVNAAGDPQWTANGVPLCTATADQVDPRLVSDGLGGAIVVWSDNYSLGFGVYARRITATGVPQWGSARGIPVCTWGLNAGVPLDDGSGGAIIGVIGYRGGHFDLYAQRLSSTGTRSWGDSGVAVCTAPFDQFRIGLVRDDSGGAIITWEDERSGYDIYAQRVNPAGDPQWTMDGKLVRSAVTRYHGMCSDGAGGAIIAWADSSNDADVYAQRIGANGDLHGDLRWLPNGVVVSAATYRQAFPWAISDGLGGAIIAWDDGRAGNLEQDIYAARVYADGRTPTLASFMGAEANTERILLTWYTPDAAGFTTTLYRRTENTDWVALSTVNPNGTGQITYEDRAIEPGKRYGYRLGIHDQNGEQFFGEAWVDVPRMPLMSLGGPRPNPANRDLIVSFSLASNEPATLDLADVAGRRVVLRRILDPSPGNHVINLRESAGVPPGMYLLRLTQGGHSISRKACVVH